MEPGITPRSAGLRSPHHPHLQPALLCGDLAAQCQETEDRLVLEANKQDLHPPLEKKAFPDSGFVSLSRMGGI